MDGPLRDTPRLHCLHTCLYTCLHTCLCTCVYRCLYPCLQAYLCTCLYACRCTCPTRMSVHMSVHTPVDLLHLYRPIGPPCPRTRLCHNGNPRLCIHTHTSVYGAHPKHLSKRIGYAACRLPQYLWSTRQRDGRATRRRAGHTPASTLPAVWHSLRCRRSGKRRVRAVCDPDPTIATLLK